MGQYLCGLSLLAIPAAAVGQEGGSAMPVQVTGAWSVTIGPGTVELEGRKATVAEEVVVDVSPSVMISVEGEAHARLPVFNPETGGWQKGARLSRLVTQECSATGNLIPESVVVRPEHGEAFVLDEDYAMDGFWATLGRLEGGRIAADQNVLIDYVYSPDRLDSVVVNEAGEVRLAVGEPGVGAMLPAEPAEGEVAVANIWVPGRTEELADENLFPIEPLLDDAPAPVAEELLPKTLAKLRAEEDVTIVAWGDSVTNGGGVGGKHPELWYQNQFAERLRERFPQASITLLTAAWGSRNSRVYMDAPPGGDKDFVRDVLEPKPDLVTIEFVNDAYLHGEALETQYTEIMEHLNGIGAEVILITPHLVRPDWMGKDTLKFDEDPRPYVAGLRRFAEENGIALADASQKWCLLWRRGIPYVTLEANSINHPDARGHELFAEALMEVFPTR